MNRRRPARGISAVAFMQRSFGHSALGTYDSYVDNLSTPPTECPDCGESHGSSCPWRETCAECSRTDVDMQEPRLCVDCAEEIERHELAMRKRERALDWGEYLQERGAL